MSTKRLKSNTLSGMINLISIVRQRWQTMKNAKNHTRWICLNLILMILLSGMCYESVKEISSLVWLLRERQAVSAVSVQSFWLTFCLSLLLLQRDGSSGSSGFQRCLRAISRRSSAIFTGRTEPKADYIFYYH